jgi:hypothetical protein
VLVSGSLILVGEPDKVRGQRDSHKGSRDTNANATVGYACPGIPFITMIDHQYGYSKTNPNGALQDVGHKVE